MTAHSKEPTMPLASTVTPFEAPPPPAVLVPAFAKPPGLALAPPKPKFGSWSQVPSTRVGSEYCGLVACCRRWKEMLDPTAIWSPWGTDEIGSNHENSSAGP